MDLRNSSSKPGKGIQAIKDSHKGLEHEGEMWAETEWVQMNHSLCSCGSRGNRLVKTIREQDN